MARVLPAVLWWPPAELCGAARQTFFDLLPPYKGGGRFFMETALGTGNQGSEWHQLDAGGRNKLWQALFQDI
jgi:hypothetical protein